MNLILEVEYLTGVSYAAVGPESADSEWPPQPDRIFSALVASWAYHGAVDSEKQALEWLEKLPPPRIYAAGAASRTEHASFVPPNDPSSLRSKKGKGVSLLVRRRQLRTFPAKRLENATVLFVWPDIAFEPSFFSPLARIAKDTAYVGHSASLTRCRFFWSDTPLEPGKYTKPRRRIYPGRLAELCAAYDSGRRPDQGGPVISMSAATTNKLPQSVFDTQWLLLESLGEKLPDLRAAALVSRKIRTRLLSGYRKVGWGDRVPEVISGHRADGSPSAIPHLAIIPLAFVGFSHADGHLLGFALVPPRGSGILKDGDFLTVMRKLFPRRESGRREMSPLELVGKWQVTLALTNAPPYKSMDSSLYTEPARVFATVTPIVLDRFLKQDVTGRQGEIVDQIVDACHHIGLPDPEAITVHGTQQYAVVPGKYATFEGVPPAWTSRQLPSWTRWQLPPHLVNRMLTHAVIRFAEPVQGPVILGAGRYLGMGLCRRVAE